MRVLCIGVGQRIFGDDAGGWIELADQGRAVAGEPDVAGLILRQPVRTGGRRLHGVFPDRTGLGIEPAELVGKLAGPPDRAVACSQRVVRPRTQSRNIPHPDIRLHRTIDQRSLRSRPFGKVLDEVVGHGAPFFRGNRRVRVLHHLRDGEPAFGGIADAHAIDVMAAVAGRNEPCLARPFRPFLLGVLGLGRRRAKRDNERQHRQRSGPHAILPRARFDPGLCRRISLRAASPRLRHPSSHSRSIVITFDNGPEVLPRECGGFAGLPIHLPNAGLQA